MILLLRLIELYLEYYICENIKKIIKHEENVSQRNNKKQVIYDNSFCCQSYSI